MDRILELRVYHGEAKAAHAGLKQTQAELNSPTFSCRNHFPAEVQEPKHQSDIWQILSKKSKNDIDRQISILFNGIEKLKNGIEIISLQNDLAVRRGQNAEMVDKDIEKMDAFLNEAQVLKESIFSKIIFEERDHAHIADFFEIAVMRLNNARMGIEVPEVMELSEDEILRRLTDRRFDYAMLSVEAIVLKLTEVGQNQVACLQFERAVCKKVIPDNEVVREQLQSYRLSSNRALVNTGRALALVQDFLGWSTKAQTSQKHISDFVSLAFLP